MTLTVHVSGLDPALARVRNAPRQIRFALFQAINKTAERVQSHTTTELLPEKFTLRSRGAPWWKPRTRMGFNIKFARRSDPTPQAIVGSRADWLPLQEEGGTKSAGGKSLALPVVGTSRPSMASVIPRRLKPKRLLQRRRVFVAEGTRGKVILSRVGKARYPIKFWYAFEKTTTIKPVLTFGPTESLVAYRHLHPAFTLALRKALATAK